MIKKYLYYFILVFTIVILSFACFIFFNNYSHLKKDGNFHTRRDQRPTLPVEKIQGWMTFEYINRNFNLPPDYLKQNLSITSKQYPNITIAKAASIQGESVDSFLEHVKESIKKAVSLPNGTQNK